MTDRPYPSPAPPANRRREAALKAVAVALSLLSAAWLAYQFWRLVLDNGPTRAVDLRLRVREVIAWFDGAPVYATIHDAVYPPASYAMLGALLGGMETPTARVWWACLHVVVLVLLVFAARRIGGGRTPGERAVLAVLPLSLYGTGATLGNGQLGLLVALALTTAASLFARPPNVGRDACIAGALLFALVKPTMAAPFFFVFAFLPNGARPAAWTVLGYGALTWVGSLWQERGPVGLFLDWANRAEIGSVYGATRGSGAIREGADGVLRVTHVNLHSALSYFDRVDLSTEATCVALLAFGAGVWWLRRGPIWVLAALAALVARVYAYHAWYDDVLLLVPLLALARLAQGLDGAGPRLARVAAVSFVALLSFSIAPGGTYALPNPWNAVYVLTQAALCGGVLVLLAAVAFRVRRGVAPSA